MKKDEIILDKLALCEAVGRTELAGMLPEPVSDATLKRALQRLAAAGKVEVSGRARATRYRLAAESLLLERGDLEAYFRKDADGREIKRAAVYAKVWNFTLPDTPHSASSFGLGEYEIYSRDRELYSGDDYVTYTKYYDMLIENNISPTYPPYGVLDERADAYLSDPRLTSFTISESTDPTKDNFRFKMTDDELRAATFADCRLVRLAADAKLSKDAVNHFRGWRGLTVGTSNKLITLCSFLNHKVSRIFIHFSTLASEGIRKSPLGDKATLPTLGPSGMQDLLNCCAKNLR